MLIRWWDWARGKTGPPVTVILVSGNDVAAVAMADEVGRSQTVARLVVSWGAVERKQFRGVGEFIALDAHRPWRSLLGLRRQLSKRRVDLAVFRLSPDAPFWRRWSVLAVTGRTLLAFNEDGESHRIEWGRPIAAWRFLRGVPRADIHRPTRLGFLREWLQWLGVAPLLAAWLWRRRKTVNLSLEAPAAGGDGCAVLCVPGMPAAQLDREVRACPSAELAANYEPLLPDADTVAKLRRRLQQPDVWLVWGRANFKHVLGEGWAPHRPRESGTFCLGANSSLLAFRRDVFLELGGLAALEKQLPGQGWIALSLRGWLRGYKTVYAGDIDFRGLKPTQLVEHPVAGPPLASLLPVCDDVRTAARLLHRHARTPEFRGAYRNAVRRLDLPRAGSNGNGRLAPLPEPGAVIFAGREVGCRFRLAMVAADLPSPTAGHGLARVHHLMRRLAGHCDIFLFCYAAKTTDSQIEALLESCARLVLMQPGPDPVPALAGGPPAGVGRYQTLAMRRHLEVLLSDWKIPLVEIEGTHLAAAGSWLRSASAATILAAPHLRFALDQRARRSTLLASGSLPKRDVALWRRYESRALAAFDCIVTASGADRDLLAERIPSARLRVVENGVDREHFDNEEPDPAEDSVLWIGEFEDPVNLPAFQVLLQRIWPLVRDAWPRAQLTVVAGADYRLHWRRRSRRGLPELPPEVTVLGHVGDLRPLYRRAAVVVAPAPAAGAASPRVLEAFAMSRPVVAAKAACEGLAVEPGRDLLIAAEPAEFAAAILKLLGNEALRRKLGRQARAGVAAKHTWERSVEQQLNVYEELRQKKA